MAYELISRLADVDGDGTGEDSGVGDFSTVSRLLQVTAAPGEHISINRMIVGFQGGTIANGAVYGSGSALTNGIMVYVTDANASVQYDLTDLSHPIKANGHWAHYCYDYAVYGSDLPTGDDFAAARWTFGKTGQLVELLPGWSFNVLLQDDFRTATTGLTVHQFLVQGFYQQPRIGDGATGQGHA